jgi:uncharacterized protein YndB with AHSA1/START domain
MPETVSVERTINAPADLVSRLVADLPRMGEWSPENAGGEWTNGATAAAVGATFKGNNQNGPKKWHTSLVVTKWEPGREFAFRVNKPVKVADWSYTFKDNGAGGCTVTESWTDLRPFFIKKLGKMFSGVADRAAYNREGMRVTLEKLASTAEALATSQK